MHFIYTGTFLTDEVTPHPPLVYSTITPLCKDQHQGHQYFMPQNI